jgi:hypothetical protein
MRNEKCIRGEGQWVFQHIWTIQPSFSDLGLEGIGRLLPSYKNWTSPHCPIWLSTMDVIHVCLNLAPVPYLSPAFSTFKFIWSQIAQVQASDQQLEVLAQSLAQLLKTLNAEYSAGRLIKARTSSPLANLCRCVRSTMGKTLILISTMQSLEGNLGFRSARGITRVSEITLYQRSKNRSDWGLPPAHWGFNQIVSGKLRSFWNWALNWHGPKR